MHPTAAFLALVLGGLSTPLPSVPQEADNPVRNPRPNLVVFLVDDLGWQDLSLPLAPEATAFNDRYRTPNVERLAATGVSFTSAYASAVCSPTRTSLLTGLNAARHRVTNWTLRVGRDPSQTARGLRAPEWRLEGWQPGGPTLPGLLSDAGYTTIHVGKAHWGAKETAGEDPRALGFDVSIGGHAAGGPGSYHGEHDYSAAWRQADRIWDVPDLEAYHGSSVHLTEALTLEAVGAVEQAVRNDRPFFLHLAHYAVHAPFEEHAPWVERYRAQGLDETEARYASMIEGMDASLGALLFALDRLGVAENTLILFLSDNGGLCFAGRGRTPTGTGNYTHNAPLRSGKGSAYEGGTRIPMVVSWARLAAEPRGLQAELAPEPGSRCDRAVHVDDILPTLCALAGVTDLERLAPTLDGFDLSPLLRGEVDWRRPGPLIFHFPHFYHHSQASAVHGYSPHSAIRDGRYKAIVFHDRPREEAWELYDLEEDLSEARDLAGEEPEVLDRLARDLLQRLEAMEAQFPRPVDGDQEIRPELPAGT